MPVDCPSGYEARPLPAAPATTTTLNVDNTYVRVSYDWELADNSPPLGCACGQKCTFTFAYGLSTEGTVFLQTPVGGGGVGAGETAGSEVSVEVGSEEFEHLGFKVFLKETTETGTVTTSGGFASGGFFDKLKFAFRFAREGLGALLPRLTYNPPDKTTSRFVQANIKVCRRPCT